MEPALIFKNLGIALGLGLLVGLQRERVDSPLAGIRTFPLITAFGTICALLGQTFGGWIVAMGLVAMAAIVAVGNIISLKTRAPDPGLTTEVTMLLMFGIGAYLVAGPVSVALACGGAVALLLHWKPQMHTLAAKIGDRDFRAIMQFVLVSLVILPVLPNEYYGPFKVLNPFRIWLMVVLIVSLSLAGYVAYKWLGQKATAWLNGILGGLISSTATTVNYARASRSAPSAAGLAAFVILVASAVSFLRVLALIAATGPTLLQTAAAPFGIFLGVLLLLCGAVWFKNRKGHLHQPQQHNPSELKPALLFALLFAVILLATAAGKQYFGQSGTYVVAILSGLTDMDAITLSVTQMLNGKSVEADTAWRLILAATLSNLVFKTGTVVVVGSGLLARQVGLLFGLALVTGMLILFLYPGAREIPAPH